MKLKTTSSIAVILLLLATGVVRGQATFEKEIEFGEYANGSAVLQTLDGGYLVGGSKWIVKNADTADYFPCLVKFDSNGNTQWAKFLGKDFPGEISALVKSSDGNFFASGYIVPDSTGRSKSFVMKLGSTGEIIWVRLYQNNSGFLPLTPCDDGGCIVCGDITGTLHPTIKIDADGRVAWIENISFGGSFHNATSIIHLEDSSYVIIGDADENGNDITLLKIGISGDIRWYKFLSGPSSLFDFSSCSTRDGGFALSGVVQLSSDNTDIYVAKFDASGSLLWGKEVDEFSFEEGMSIAEGNNGDLIVACFGNPTGAMIMTVSKEGEVVSLKSLVDPRNSATQISDPAIIRSSDGGFVYTGGIGNSTSHKGGGIILGKLDSFAEGCNLKNELYTVKSVGTLASQTFTSAFGGSLDSLNLTFGADLSFSEIDLCNFSSVSSKQEDGNISLYPNPLRGNDLLIISVDASLPAGMYEIFLVDLLGNIIRKEKTTLLGMKQEIPFHVSECASGIYFIEIKNENEWQVLRQIKLVKE